MEEVEALKYIGVKKMRECAAREKAEEHAGRTDWISQANERSCKWNEKADMRALGPSKSRACSQCVVSGRKSSVTMWI